MTQAEINRAVSQATGEPIREIRRRGFIIADELVVAYNPEPWDLAPQTVDWDDVESRRLALFP